MILLKDSSKRRDFMSQGISKWNKLRAVDDRNWDAVKHSSMWVFSASSFSKIMFFLGPLHEKGLVHRLAVWLWTKLFPFWVSSLRRNKVISQIHLSIRSFPNILCYKPIVSSPKACFVTHHIEECLPRQEIHSSLEKIPMSHHSFWQS